MSVITYFPGAIDIYDKSFTWLGRIGNPISIRGSVVFNGLSTFTVEVSADDRLVPDLIAYGARVTMIYKDKQLFSGMITGVTGSLLSSGSVFLEMQSDWRILQNTVALVRPGNQIEATAISVKNNDNPAAQAQAWLPGGATTQGTSGTTLGQVGYYQWASGVVYSETALKTIIGENVITRLGRPVTLATDLNRGGNIKAAGKLPEVRMQRLEDVCLEILSFDGLGLTLQQATRANTITVDVYEPDVWDMPLTVNSGVIVGGSWSIQSPTATRAILGAPGDLADRQFVNYTTGSSTVEAEWGDLVEVFRDATSSADLIYPEGVTVEELKVAKYYELRTDVTTAQKTTYRNSLNAAGKRALDEGAAKFGITAELAETETFTFGGTTGVQLGDQVTIEGLNGTLYQDIITECKFDFGDQKLKVTPIVGKRVDDPNVQIANAITTLANSQRRISTDR